MLFRCLEIRNRIDVHPPWGEMMDAPASQNYSGTFARGNLCPGLLDRGSEQERGDIHHIAYLRMTLPRPCRC